MIIKLHRALFISLGLNTASFGLVLPARLVKCSLAVLTLFSVSITTYIVYIGANPDARPLNDIWQQV